MVVRQEDGSSPCAMLPRAQFSRGWLWKISPSGCASGLRSGLQAQFSAVSPPPFFHLEVTHSPSRSISQSGSQSVRARGPGRQRHTASPATSRRTNESLPQDRNLPPSSLAVLLCNSRVTIHRPSFGDGLRSVRTLWQHTSARACDSLPSALEESRHDRSI